jgi:hypothetical protein
MNTSDALTIEIGGAELDHPEEMLRFFSCGAIPLISTFRSFREVMPPLI